MKLDDYGNKESNWAASGEYQPGVDPELKHCPFCASTNATVVNTHTASYWAECEDCGATCDSAYRFGGAMRTRASANRHHRRSFYGAIKAWNNRH